MTGTIDPLARAAMVAYCGWDPTAAPVTDQTDTLDGDGSPILMLPSLNVTDVSAVTVTFDDGVTLTPAIGPGATVQWSGNGVLEYRCGAWPEGRRNITVTWSGGYAADSDDVTLLNAALESLSSRTTKLVPQSAKMGTASFTLAATIAAGGFLVTEQMVFDRYRLPRVA